MANYIVRRLLILPIILIGLSLLIFAMISLLNPYTRASLYVNSPPKTENALNQLVVKYGLDKPIPVQYWNWLSQVVRGNLGWSKTAERPVLQAILAYFPATLELSIWSFIPIIVIGVWLGVQAAIHQDQLIDQVARIFSIIGYSFPVFVFGLLVLMIFYAKLQWFPPGRLSQWASQIVGSASFHPYTGMNSFDALLNGRFDIFLDALRHLVLPAVTLSYVDWALILRVTRSSMLDVVRQDYVMVARAKGLKESDVINKHARPNALIPVATVGGLLLVGLMNGVVITETVFDYHGIGFWIAQSALQLDVVSVLGVTLFEGTLLVLANLVVDVLYASLDPRIRLS
ncbi:MAG: ABC transporter permease [Anaerolineales bacterium]|jgi:peptide/nickel transport system permease protein